MMGETVATQPSSHFYSAFDVIIVIVIVIIIVTIIVAITIIIIIIPFPIVTKWIIQLI